MPRDEVLFYTGLPRLEIDGAEDPMVAELLLSMQMTESEGGMSSLELCFANAARIEGLGNDLPFETDSNPSLKLGAEIRLVTGDTHQPQEVFQGKITGLELVLEGAEVPKLIVLAEDALQSARLRRRTKVFEALTLDDLVNEVAGESGLRVVSAGLTRQIKREVQANETDLGFLRRICSRFDVDFQIVGSELQISPRSAVDRGTRPLEFGETLTRFRALADLADQVSQVTLAGWDHAASRPFDVVSGPGADTGPGQGRKGAAFLEDSFGLRSEHITGLPVQDQDEAQAVADAMFAARQRRFVSAEGSVTGDPGLRVGTVVEITGTGPRFDNSYYVTHCQHRYGPDEGYVTDFRAETAFFGDEMNLPFNMPKMELAYGQVTEVGHPDGAFQVKIRLHGLSDAKNQDYELWARVSVPFAGADYGAVFLPDVGDEVIVGFVGGNMAHPIVLGSLFHGSAQPPEKAAEGGGVNHWSLNGHKGTRVALDESDGSAVTLETAGGVKVQVTDSGNKVVCTNGSGSVTIAPGGITVRTGATVTVEASQVDISAPMVNVDAAISKFTGVVSCDVLQTNTVISSTYTPGAGNIW